MIGYDFYVSILGLTLGDLGGTIEAGIEIVETYFTLAFDYCTTLLFAMSFLTLFSFFLKELIEYLY